MNRVLLAFATLAAVMAAAPAVADEALAKSRNCMACHGIDRKAVGPSFKEIASKYGRDAGASAALAEKIQKGSKGVWGAVPMPPNAGLSADDAQKLSA